MNQDVATQMIVSDEGLATAFIVTSKWPLPCVLAKVRVELPGLAVIGAAVRERADEPPREWQERRGRGCALAGRNERVCDGQGGHRLCYRAGWLQGVRGPGAQPRAETQLRPGVNGRLPRRALPGVQSR